MISIVQRSSIKVFFAFFAVLLFVSLTAQTAGAAVDGSEKDGSEKERDKRACTPAASGKSTPDCALAQINVSYVLYNDVMRIDPARSKDRYSPTESEADENRVTAGSGLVNSRPRRVGFPSPPPAGSPTGVSTAPMTAGEKFMLFLTKSFKPPGPYALSILSGAFGEWTDDDHHHHSNPGDFAADTMTRAARSFAFRATANFFEKFAYPVAFKQDPRYHRSGRGGAGARIGYAVSRLFVTQSDRGGRDQFNASYLFGGLTAAAISNAWEREERQTAPNSLRRWGIHMGLTAFSNIVREFIGGQ